MLCSDAHPDEPYKPVDCNRKSRDKCLAHSCGWFEGYNGPWCHEPLPVRDRHDVHHATTVAADNIVPVATRAAIVGTSSYFLTSSLTTRRVSARAYTHSDSDAPFVPRCSIAPHSGVFTAAPWRAGPSCRDCVRSRRHAGLRRVRPGFRGRLQLPRIPRRKRLALHKPRLCVRPKAQRCLVSKACVVERAYIHATRTASITRIFRGTPR